MIASMMIALMMGFGSAHASTRGWVDDDRRLAGFTATNGGTADADFIWNLLAVPTRASRDLQFKEAASKNQEISFRCWRHREDAAHTACVVIFRHDDDTFVTLDPDFGAFAALDGAVAAEMKTHLVPPSGPIPYRQSPDGHFSVCWDCGANETQLQINWKFSPIHPTYQKEQRQ